MKIHPLLAVVAVAILGSASPTTVAQPASQNAAFNTTSVSSTAGVSISAHVSVAFDAGAGTKVTIMQSSYADNAFGADASEERILAGLDQAAMAGLQQALANGARTGRADVVALAYKVDPGAGAGQSWAPLGLFIQVTEMQVDANGRATFTTRLGFIADSAATKVSSLN